MLSEKLDAWRDALLADVESKNKTIEQAAIAEQAAPAGEAVITDEMAYAFHRAIGDGSLSQDDVSSIKAGLTNALHGYTTQQPAECKRCAECSEYLKECEAPLQRMQRDQKDMGALLCLLTKEKEKVVELAADRDSADAFSKKLADVCEKAEAQVIALMEDKARAEAVIEKCEILATQLNGLSAAEKILAAIADYQKGVKS